MTVATERRSKVLVVEDDPGSRLIMAEILGQEGYEVIQARNGEEALNIAARDNPNVILLDIGLPGMSGLDVLRRLKSSPSTSGSSVVIVSAYSFIVDHDDSIKPDGFVQKPFGVDDLVDSVNQALSATAA